MVAPGDRTAMILLGHGARDPEWRRPIEGILALLRQQHPDLRVELAFHEFIGPTLEEAVARLHGDGHRNMTVVPIFIAQGGHLRQEVPSQVAMLGRRFPDCRFFLASAVGESPAVQQAIAVHCAAMACRKN